MIILLVTSTVIAGLLKLTLKGYNLGDKLGDVKSVTVKGFTCTSLLHFSSELIHCMIVNELALLTNTLTDNDVSITTIGGTFSGIYAQPLLAFKSGSGRPVLSEIIFDTIPFLPYGVTLRKTSIPMDGHSVEDLTLYWSNIAIGAFCIQRSRIDGSLVETIINNVCNYRLFHINV